jgi:MFS family permease
MLKHVENYEENEKMKVRQEPLPQMVGCDTCVTRFLRKNKIALTIYSACWAFVCYFSMYAFRKPFSASKYEGLTLWGGSYKVWVVMFQLIGYTLSKFIGVKVIGGLDQKYAGILILIFIGIAELTLVLFGAIPQPWNIIPMFLNGIPLGMIWGLVFSFLQGRTTSELLACGLSISFIVSSGVVKQVGSEFLNKGMNQFWMPAVVGAIFAAPLVLSVFMLEMIPEPDEEDVKTRTERPAMTREGQKEFVKLFWPGLVLLVLFHTCLGAYRDFRDNFMAELWKEFGYGEQPSMFSKSEIIVAVCVLVPVGLFMLIRRPIWTFLSYHALMLAGLIVTGICTFPARNDKVDGLAYMIVTGFGLYICYIPFSNVMFESLIAAFAVPANGGFIMYICDSFAYTASIVVMAIKNWAAGEDETTWLNFYFNLTFAMAAVGICLCVGSGFYHFWKSKNWKGLQAELGSPEENEEEKTSIKKSTGTDFGTPEEDSTIPSVDASGAVLAIA